MSAQPPVLHFQAAGNGADCVVLLHAWALNRSMWSAVSEQLAPTCRLIAVDMRGHGASPPPDPGRQWTIEEAVEEVVQVVEVVTDATGGRPAIVGCSFGATVALAAAALRPDLFSAAVAIGGCAKWTRAADHPWGIGEEEASNLIASLEADFEGTVRELTPLLYLTDDDQQAASRAFSSIIAAIDRKKAPGQIQILRSVYASDIRPLLGSIRLPALVLHGSRDAVVPVESAVDLSSRIPASQLVLIEGAGHLPALTAPVATAEKIVRFMRTRSQQAGDEESAK